LRNNLKPSKQRPALPAFAFPLPYDAPEHHH
jgi:hypothetical protein